MPKRFAALAAAVAAEPVERDLLPLTTDGVRAIASIADPALRNLWITQSYADLSQRLGRQLGTDHTWCTFAVWASNTAGESIRGQELPAFMEHFLFGHSSRIHAVADAANAHPLWLRWTDLMTRIEPIHIDEMAREAVADVSKHIAHGNTLVYAELAPLFVKFVERFELDTPEAGAMDDVLDKIGVPYLSVEPLVRRAFQYYYRAIYEQDPMMHAQLILAGNISAVLHEQERLQEDIAAALNACVVNLEDSIRQSFEGVLHGWLERRVIDRALARISRPAEALWDHLATTLLMTMKTPDETLVLHRDVPLLPNGRRFPAALTSVTFGDLHNLLAQWDTADSRGVGSGATNWANLHERMGYIVNLFRSRQQSRSLTQAPFTPAELDCMRNHELPPRDQSWLPF